MSELGNVTIVRVRNVIDGREPPESTSVPVVRGQRLIRYLPEDFDATAGHVVRVNGRDVVGAAVATFIPRDGDRIYLAEVPGITPLVTGAIIGAATGVSAAAAATGFVAIASAFVLNVALSVALNFAISALTPKPRRRRASQDSALGDDRDAPLSSFRAQQNTIGPGVTVPIVYGRVKILPHIVESFQQPRFDELDNTAAGVTTIDPDGKSEQDAVYLHTRAVICHGPIEAVEEIELDDNDIAAVAGTQYEILTGTNAQKVPEGFGETKLVRSVESGVVYSTPVVASTVSDCESFEAELLFPSGLFRIDDEGNLRQRDVDVLVEYRRGSSGSFTTWKAFTVSGATRSPKPVWIRGPSLTRGVYEIRVSRTTADSVDIQIVDDFRFETLNAVSRGGSAHPGLAQIAIRNLPGEQSAIWRKLACVVRGRNDVRIYSDENNYTTGYTANPAWCCAHWLTHATEGVGKFFTYERNVDVPSFIRWAKYAAELVDDGKGGLRPRAEFNHVFDQPTNGQEFLAAFTAGSGVSVVQIGARWTAIIDRPEPMVQLFNESNVVPGTLRVSNVPRTERATRLTASFRNEDNAFEFEPITLEDDDVAPSDGHVDESLTVDGVTATHTVAWQLARVLGQNRYSTRTCEFETGIEAIALRVGDVFGLAHPAVGSAVATGILAHVSSDQTTVRLDDTVELNPASSYDLVIAHVSDAFVERRRLVGVTADPTHVVATSGGWERTLRAGDRYSIVEGDVELYRCIGISLGEGLSRKVAGTLYDERAYPDSIRSLEDAASASVVRSVRKIATPVGGLTLRYRQSVQTLVDPDTNAANVEVLAHVIDVDWRLPDNGFVDRYEVWFRESTAASWVRAGSTTGRHFEIRENVATGVEYEVAVVAVNPAGVAQSITAAARALVTTT